MKLKQRDYTKIKEISTDGRFTFYEYKPTLFRPFLVDIEPMTFVRRIRLLLEYVQKGGFLVYYLADQGDFIAHCVVVPGGRRIKCTTRNDIVIGPLYVEKDKRGNGYSVMLIREVLNKCKYPYKYAFGYTAKNNYPTQRANERCGFKLFAEMNVVGFTRKPIIVDSGKLLVYRYDNTKREES